MPSSCTVACRAAAWALLLLAVGHSAAPADQLYWSDSLNHQIWRSNLDGSDAQVLLPLSAGAEPRGIAVDAAGGRIYWAENGTNRILRANLDGTGITDLGIAGLAFPADLELDLVNGKLYWADRDNDHIRRANLDGSNPETMVNLPAPGNNAAPYFITLDVPANHLYWSLFDAATIHRSNLDGTGQGQVLAGQDRVRDMVVDAAGGKLYFADRDLRVIRTAGLDGSNVTTLYGPAGLVLPHGIDLDPIAGMVYWADSDGQKIFRGSLDGSVPMQAIVSAGLGNPWDIQVVLTVVPEPGSLVLLGMGTLGLAIYVTRKRGTWKR